MTKHEYIEEYGETNACLCDQCGEYFPPSDIKIEIEPHGEEWGTCPYCGCDNIHYLDSFDMREEDEEESEGDGE